MEPLWIWALGLGCTAHLAWTVALLVRRARRHVGMRASDRRGGRTLRFARERRRFSR